MLIEDVLKDNTTIFLLSAVLQDAFKVSVIAQLANGRTSTLIIRQAVTDELLPSFSDSWLLWKAHLGSIEHNLMLQDIVLSFAISEWPSPVQHLEVDNTYTPYIYFVADSNIVFSHKALWR